MSEFTFIAADGKEYLADTWYSWPFVVDRPGTCYQKPHKISMLPVDFDRCHLLRIRYASGEGFYNPYCGEKKTHWKLQLSGHYEI